MKNLTQFVKNLLPYWIKRRVVLLVRFLFSRKTVVVILSSMRAGSTLLKALIAEAPEASHLQETDFRKFYSEKHGFDDRIYQLSKKRILVMKLPYAFHDMAKVRPCPKGRNVKIIVLVRDVYGVVESIEKRKAEMESSHMTKSDLVDYWCESYESILKSLDSVNANLLFIRYEDLTANPKEITKKIFQFIGSKKKDGVENYRAPKDFEWRWGFDDGGENIKKLTVTKSFVKAEEDDKELLRIIEHSPRVRSLRKKFGYIQEDLTVEKINDQSVNYYS